jgi:uncharacterized membrane protein SpoIIM required for sporulation
MTKIRLSILGILSISAWLVPFILTLILVKDLNKSNNNQVFRESELDETLLSAYKAKNRLDIFRLIFSNNLRVASINVVGGIFLGIVTLLNLIQNGFYAGCVFSSLHNNGMSWKNIIIHTAPHSFEMLGIWLSGGLGFYIALLLHSAIRKNDYPTSGDYRKIGIGILISVLLIFLAAYVEAYISIA